MSGLVAVALYLLMRWTRPVRRRHPSNCAPVRHVAGLEPSPPLSDTSWLQVEEIGRQR